MRPYSLPMPSDAMIAASAVGQEPSYGPEREKELPGMLGAPAGGQSAHALRGAMTDQQLGDLNGVRGSAFAQVIAHTPKRQPVFV